jgi:hypothetical protein
MLCDLGRVVDLDPVRRRRDDVSRTACQQGDGTD